MPKVQDVLRPEQAVIAYLDLANMFYWQSKVLRWKFRIEDLIAGVLALPNVREVKVYYGMNGRDPARSVGLHKRIRKAGATLRTKPVKFIKKTVNEALVFKQSTVSLFDPGVSSSLAALVTEIERSGVVIEEPKCNFDVEIAMDIMDDLDKVSAVMLFSGDSDLAAPLERAKLQGRRAYVVGVRGMVAGELFAVADAYFDFGKVYTGPRRR